MILPWKSVHGFRNTFRGHVSEHSSLCHPMPVKANKENRYVSMIQKQFFFYLFWKVGLRQSEKLFFGRTKEI